MGAEASPPKALIFRDRIRRTASLPLRQIQKKSWMASYFSTSNPHHYSPLTPPSSSPKDNSPATTATLLTKRNFSIWYHVKLIVRETIRLVWYLIRGTPKWLRELALLLCFVMALMPGFLVFAWHYVSCDRVSVSYRKRRGGTSRHYVDIYGSSDKLRSDYSDDGSSSSNDDDDDDPVKPVVVFLTGGAWIIGYKMWGTLLARALVPSGVLVMIPDYRNFPQANVEEMIDDVDLAVQWVVDNCRNYGGDPDRIVLVGQSAGAHLGSCIMLRKAYYELAQKQSKPPNNTSWKATDMKGFIPVSAPFNLVSMQEHFHRRGLDRNIVSAIFSHRIESCSPTHMLRTLETKFREDVGKVLPSICVIHGTEDKSVPFEVAVEFASCLDSIKADVTTKLYDGWSHTDPILEAPMDGDHKFHRDIYNLVKRWTDDDDDNGSSSNRPMNDFDKDSPYCRRICPAFLIPIGRYCNPF